jgi:hypothetical protein
MADTVKGNKIFELAHLNQQFIAFFFLNSILLSEFSTLRIEHADLFIQIISSHFSYILY